MNYLQLFMIFVFGFASLIAGTAVMNFLPVSRDNYLNRMVYIAECLLIGSIVLSGLLMFLSLVNCYRAPFLWAAVLASYVFLLNTNVRVDVLKVLFSPVRWDIYKIIFCILILFFLFRNSYFNIDIDSMTNYLYSQKIWLERASSLPITRADNYHLFIPQFDFLPTALGLSILPQETFFAQLVQNYWRTIAFVLIFGYASYRLNSAFALAAVMLVLFNDHIYYSGANKYVLINGAVLSLLFAAAYNFQEAAQKDSSHRFLLAFIFCVPLIANKYQLLYCMVVIVLLGCFIQKNLHTMLKAVLSKKRMMIAFWGITILSSLFFLRNFIVTGDPFYPILAGKFNLFGWTAEQGRAYQVIAGGLEPMKFVKFVSFFFIWPGMLATKYVLLVLLAFPLLILCLVMYKRLDEASAKWVGYWLTLSLFMVAATAMASFIDPRYFRYCLLIFSFTAVASVYFIMSDVLNIKNTLVISVTILLMSMPGFKIMFTSDGPFRWPTIKENINVLLDRMHTQDAKDKHFPEISNYRNILEDLGEKSGKLAYHVEGVKGEPLFFLPTRPLVGLYRSTVIHWESYEKVGLIEKDLTDYGIEYVFNFDRGQVLTKSEFAKEIVNSVNRYPTTILTDYGLPAEVRKR